MRILHFSSSDGIFGSAQCLKELLVQEVINGHTPIVVTPQKNQINSFCDDNKIENYYFFVFYLIYRIADFVGEKRDLVASLIIVLLVVLGKVAEIVFADNLFSQYANPILLEFVYGIVLWYLVGHIKTKNYVSA